METTPFFERAGAMLQPTPISAGPWDPNTLHGRVVIGLLGAELEAAYGGPDFTPARLTVDMYRMPAFDPVEVKVRPIREGRRIRVAEAEFFSGGRSMARATGLFLLRSEPPAGEVWTPPPWKAPPPDQVPPPPKREGYQAPWEMRPVSGTFGSLGERTIWMREVRELVGGTPMTPFTRVALAADLASPYANSGSAGLKYINSDVTLYLHRLPTTDWVGMEVVDHGATDGVAHGACRVHDETGAIGSASVAALVQGGTVG